MEHERSKVDTWSCGILANTTAPPLGNDGPGFMGPYRILVELGKGGMGVVYGAIDTRLNRVVAIKRLKRAFCDDPHAKQRFEREAFALARVAHPNIVHIYEVGAFEGQPFLAMEYIEGKTLDTWLAHQRPSQDEILTVFRAAGRGLAAAHARGLVHRDFKPKNIMVGDDGRVRVVDFGLVQTLEDHTLAPETPEPRTLAPRPHTPEPGTPLTVPGSLMGTPAYMAPEQFDGEQTGPHTDQFAFCVALWEALYGVRPFFASSVPRLAKKVREGNFELVDRWLLPRWLHAALVRGLCADPDSRWPSMDALLEALDPPQARRPAMAVRGLFGSAAMVGMFALGMGLAPLDMPGLEPADDTTFAMRDRAASDTTVAVAQTVRPPAAAPSSLTPTSPLASTYSLPDPSSDPTHGDIDSGLTPASSSSLASPTAATGAPHSAPRTQRSEVQRLRREVASQTQHSAVEVQTTVYQARVLKLPPLPASLVRPTATPAASHAPLHGSVTAAGTALGSETSQAVRTPPAAEPLTPEDADFYDRRPEDYQEF